MGQVDLGQLIMLQVELFKFNEPSKSIPGQASKTIAAETQILQAAAVPKSPDWGRAEQIGAKMENLKLPQTMEQFRLQGSHLVEGQVQDLQVDEVDEGCVGQLGDSIGAQVKVLELVQPLKGVLLYGGDLVVVEMEPRELAEAIELVRAELGDAVVAQGQSQGPLVHTIWGGLEPLGVAVELQVLTAAFLRAGCA